jgi:LacI family transcriptional regulator
MKRPPTQSDVARAAGVSQNTVSLALRGDARLPGETRERIRRVAAKLGYRANPMVAALMAQVRRRVPVYRSTLALVVAGVAKSDLVAHPSLERALAGAAERAAVRGYRLEKFWLGERGLSAKRLADILAARGITGVILNPDEGGEALPALEWDRLAVAVLAHLDRRFRQFHCASAPPFRHFETAMAELRRRGYNRVGMAMPRRYDSMMDQLYSAAHGTWCPDSVPALVTEDWTARSFAEWFRRCRPDVILVRSTEPRLWLEQMGVSVPQEVGLVHLGWHPRLGDWAGVDNRPEAMGSAAADLVIDQLMANEVGLPLEPKMVLVGGRWSEGGTIRHDAEAKPRTT